MIGLPTATPAAPPAWLAALRGRLPSAQAAQVDVESLEGGIIHLRGGRQRAVLEVLGANFGLLEADAQCATLAGFAAFLDGLSFPIQILVRLVPADLDRRAADIERTAATLGSARLTGAVEEGLFLRRLGRERTLLDHRFYVVVPAPDPLPAAGRRGIAKLFARGPTKGQAFDAAWQDDARRQLLSRCDAVARGLARCELVVRRLAAPELAALLYRCWNSELAHRLGVPQPLEAYLSPLVTGGSVITAAPPREHAEDSGQPGPDAPYDALRAALGARSVADVLAPGVLEYRPDYLRLEREYVRVLKLAAYPRTVTPGWLEPLFALGQPLDVSLHIHPLDAGAVMRTLSRKLAQFQSARLIEAKGGRLADPQREVAFEDAERLREALQRGEERVFSVSVYLQLRSHSPQALDEATQRVEAALATMRARAHVASFEQDRGFRACLPQATDDLLACRNLDTSSVATMFPFSSAAPSTEGGALYGVARHGHAPVFLDPFDPVLENANHVVFAKSGAGKSFAVKVLARRQLTRGVHVLVIDPEDEYRRLCDASGGQHIRLSAAAAHRLNPFDLPRLPDDVNGAGEGRTPAPDGGDALAEQVAALLVLCELMLAERGARLGTHARAVLDRALYDTYAHAGITADPATHDRPPPVMRDLLATLAALPDPAAAGLAQRLRRYVDGSLAGLFAGPTNVALDRALTVFSIQALESELRAIAIHLITTFIWGQVRRVRAPRLLVVDEAWSLLQHEEGGAFLSSLARRARKYHLGLVTISQDVADFLGCEHGRTVLANAAIKLLLKQDGSAIEPVAQALQLTQRERQFLLGAAKGEGLLFARGARVPLTIEASEREYQLATSAPHDLSAPGQVAGTSAGGTAGTEGVGAEARALSREAAATSGPQLVPVTGGGRAG